MPTPTLQQATDEARRRVQINRLGANSTLERWVLLNDPRFAHLREEPLVAQKTQYQEEYQFNVGEYDAAVAFFVKRGFNRPAAESTAYVILAQAKIDSGNTGTITTVDVFSKNIEKTKYNVEKIAPSVKISYNIDDAINFVVKQNQLPMPVFYDMIFIDANHTYEWMKLLTQKVKPLSDGVMLFHDYYHRSTGVKKAVTEVLGEADEKIGAIGVYE